MMASSNFPRNFSHADSEGMGVRRFLPKVDRLSVTSSCDNPVVTQDGNWFWISLIVRMGFVFIKSYAPMLTTGHNEMTRLNQGRITVQGFPWFSYPRIRRSCPRTF